MEALKAFYLYVLSLLTIVLLQKAYYEGKLSDMERQHKQVVACLTFTLCEE